MKPHLRPLLPLALLSLALTMCAPAPTATPAGFRFRTPGASAAAPSGAATGATPFAFRYRTPTPSGPAATSTPAAATASPAPLETSTTPAPVVSIDPAQLKQQLDGSVPAAMSANGSSACSLALAYPDASGGLQTTFFNYGTLSQGSTVQAAPDTEYEIGSLSKLFTGDLLAIMVQDGEVSLDDPIHDYLPPGVWVPSYQGRTIALRHLATHTSGLPRDLGGSSLISRVDGVDVMGYATQAQILGFLSTYQLLEAPGTQWQYSNLANGLLGLIEARVGSKSYEKLVQQRLLDPLALQDTHIVLTDEEKGRLAQSYDAKGKDAPQFAVTGDMLAAGGYRSTARDMATYLVDNMQPDQTKLAPALQLALEKQGMGPTPDGAMGLGWIIAAEGTPQQQYYKTGATAGYDSHIAFWPSTRTGYVLLCNGRPVADLVPQLNQYLGEAASPVDSGE
jgi:CubicO group peptidase (beta-lactamase class C family)